MTALGAYDASITFLKLRPEKLDSIEEQLLT